MSARTAPGGRVATFTVAGAVRRGLADAGLAVDKRAGFGRKRERLEARAPGGSARDPPAPRVAVVGGGIAAAALMRAFRAEGLEPLRLDTHAPSPASANAAALVTPRLDAGFGPPARLHAQAFARAVELYDGEAAEAVIARGALQLARRPQDVARFARLAAWDGFAPAALRPLSAQAASAELDEPSAPDALALDAALVVEPAPVLARWLGGEAVAGCVAAIERDAQGLVLRDAAGAELARCDAVVLCCGAGLPALLPDLDLRATRGQATTAPAAFTGVPAAWGGYAVPTRDGVLFGATHDRGDADTAVRPQDDAANLRALAEGRPALAARLAGTPLAGRAAVRLAAPDHAPLAGPVAGRDGVWVLGALGGRGFTLAPLLAEHVAAGVLNLPSPLAAELAEGVAPKRLVGKASRRTRPGAGLTVTPPAR